jgi:hypothetical protein
LYPQPLLFERFCIPVAVSLASVYLQNPAFDKKLSSSIVVMALLDTGTSRTALDIRLAAHLKLLSAGNSPHQTAAGIKTMPDFTVDLQISNANLSPLFPPPRLW